MTRRPAEAGGSYCERTKKPGARQSPSREPGPDLLEQYCCGPIRFSGTDDGPYLACSKGRSFPLGATIAPGGVNFSVFAKHSAGAQLLLFEDEDAPMPSRVIDLDPRANRTCHHWHVLVPGVTAGQIYGYRIAGPFDPDWGLPFDLDKVLLDRDQ